MTTEGNGRQSDSAANVDPEASGRLSLGASVLLFLGFLAICFGLGYPAVSRYDPRTAGNYDSGMYYEMVSGREVNAPAASRVLVPTLARGVLQVVSRFDWGAWDPVLLSLLVVNSVFTSLSALIVMRLAAAVDAAAAVVVLAPFVYLSSFVVVNSHLAGLIDSAEGFFLAAISLALLRDRWLLAPLLIALGALAKETIVPLGLCGMAAWWVAVWARGLPRPRFVAVALGVSLAAGAITLGACRYLADVPAYEKHVLSLSRLARLPSNVADCLLTKTQIYAFAFLLPMGIPRLRRIPAPLLAAAGGMALLATLLGAYAEIDDNLYRPLFHTLGPVLVVSCSIFVRDLCCPARKHSPGQV